MTQALRYFLFAVLAAFVLPSFAANVDYGQYKDFASGYAAVNPGCNQSYSSSNASSYGVTLKPGQNFIAYWWGNCTVTDTRYYIYYSGTCPAPLLTGAGGKCVEACPIDPSKPKTDPSCTPPECLPGNHNDSETWQCVPDNCPSGQAWNTSQNSCYPTTPPPDPSQKAPLGYYPVGTHNPDGTGEFYPGLTAGLPANCGGWKCTYGMGDGTYAPDGNCYEYTNSPGITFCGFTPRYETDANGNPIPYTGEPTNEPPSHSAPPPANSGNPPPITCPTGQHYSYISEICVPDTSSGGPIICPAGYQYNVAIGICTNATNNGAPPTLEGPGGQPTPGTGSCPLGYVQQPDGRCTSTTPTTTCPQGYFLSNGKCLSNGTYDPTTGTPSGSNGTGTGTCGGPGQPPCKIDLGGPGDIEGPQLFELPEFEFDLSTLQPIDLGAPPAQCPPDVQLPRGIVWSWATTCSFAEWMRPIFLGMAWLFAGFIVLSGIPRD